MEKIKVKVGGMSCEHCVKAVKTVVSAINGVANVDVDLKGKTVAIEHDENVTIDMITNVIEEQGYDVIS